MTQWNVHIVAINVQLNHDDEAWIPHQHQRQHYIICWISRMAYTALIAQDTIPAGVLQQVFAICPGRR